MNDDEIISKAISILESRLCRYDVEIFTTPETTKNFLRLKLAQLKSEVFACMFLDNRNRLIKYEVIFNGTLSGCSVYPREVVLKALEYNAAAVIFAHNHPSGNSEPSQADKNITIAIKNALECVDIRSLDHIVIGDDNCTSFAERGLI